MPPRGRIQSAAVTATFLLLVAPSVYPAESSTEAMSQPAVAPDALTDEEDIDANLVPLEPELTIAPPELPSPGERSEQAGQAAESSIPTSRTTAPVQASNAPAGEAAATATAYNIPVVIDPTVEKHITFFNTSIRNRFEQWLVRLSRYRPLVEKIFSEFDLPSDLVNLSLVESGFNPYAFSRARATGPWQFMKGTGKLYGLRQNWWYDGRRDVIAATSAALDYLEKLYAQFGDWELALASYNWGEGAVARAMARNQARGKPVDYSSLTMPAETRNYLPKLIAVKNMTTRATR